MIVHVTSRDFPISDALGFFIRDRLSGLKRRHQQDISRITVQLFDINGPKGGEDKRCQIEIRLKKAAPVIIHDTCVDMYDAIQACVNRAKRIVNNRKGKAKSSGRIKKHWDIGVNDEEMAQSA